MHRTHHGEGALRRHRVSLVGASYFLTLCTADRRPGLHTASLAPAVRAEISGLQTDGYWQLRGAVIMPDHLHLFVKLTGSIGISRCVARLKSNTKLRLVQASLAWQPNFYEHRLRADEPAEPVLRYLHLNPYRKNLLDPAMTWPWFWLGEDEARWFVPLLDDGSPYPAWLR